MAQEVTQEVAAILTEEDLQRAIDLEAWCDLEEKSQPAAAASRRARVEADSGGCELSPYREVCHVTSCTANKRAWLFSVSRELDWNSLVRSNFNLKVGYR